MPKRVQNKQKKRDEMGPKVVKGVPKGSKKGRNSGCGKRMQNGQKGAKWLKVCKKWQKGTDSRITWQKHGKLHKRGGRE